MKEKVGKILKYMISAALAVVMLWFSFRDVEWAEFVAGLQDCRWWLVILSMAAGSFAFWLRAVRWRLLLLPIDPSITRLTAFNGINIGNISNFVLPRIGEFVRCGVISRRSQGNKASYDKVLGTVVLERGWELLVMLLMLAIVVIGGFDRFGSFFVEQIWNPMSGRFSFSLWWVVASGLAIVAASVLLIIRFKDSSRFCGKLVGIFSGIIQGFTSCFRMEKKWLFLAYTVFIWMTYWVMAACTVRAAPFLEGLDLIDALFLSLIGGVGFAVPVPGGIGAFHFVISLALSVVYGVPMETGIIYATISHTSQAITQIIFGAASYAYEALKK